MNMSHLKTPEQVSQFRREMARQYHPDYWPDDKKQDANEIMKMINENCDRRLKELENKK